MLRGLIMGTVLRISGCAKTAYNVLDDFAIIQGSTFGRLC